MARVADRFSSHTGSDGDSSSRHCFDATTRRSRSFRVMRSGAGRCVRRPASLAVFVRPRARSTRGTRDPAARSSPRHPNRRVVGNDAALRGRGERRLPRGQRDVFLWRDASELHRASPPELGPRLQAVRLAVLRRFAGARVQLLLGGHCGSHADRLVAPAEGVRLQPNGGGVHLDDPLLLALRAGLVGSRTSARAVPLGHARARAHSIPMRIAVALSVLVPVWWMGMFYLPALPPLFFLALALCLAFRPDVFAWRRLAGVFAGVAMEPQSRLHTLRRCFAPTQTRSTRVIAGRREVRCPGGRSLPSSYPGRRRSTTRTSSPRTSPRLRPSRAGSRCSLSASSTFDWFEVASGPIQTCGEICTGLACSASCGR